MTETPPPRHMPGRRPRFSADDVVDTAVRLGLDSFSVTAVARELGVTPAAVYRRYPSHQALLEAAVSRVLSTVPPLTVTDDGGPGWQETLTLAADAWWDLCLRHPGLPRVVSAHPEPLTRFIAGPFRSYTLQLRTFGFTAEHSCFAASLLISALDQVFRVPEDAGPGLTRDDLRRRAVDIIVTGIAGGRREWRAVSGDGEPAAPAL